MENGEVDKLRESIETIWSTMLGMEVAPGAEMATNRNQPSFLTGCIQITGAWNGAVSVDCSGKLAQTIGATMFGVEFDQTTPDQVIDALGELVNIVSGNIKSFLPEPSQLSLPSVAEGTDYFFRVVGSRQLAKLTYTCQGEPFQITIVEGTK
jgi:chemotaxis protein CheX